MKLFAPNVIVMGDKLFSISRAQSRASTPAEAERFETAIMAIRDKITATAFGRKFLDIIGNNKQPIAIVPAVETDNALTQANSGTDASSADFSKTTADGTIAFGSGRGSMTRIFINPFGTFEDVGVERTLVHELTHAYRQARGRWRPASMTQFVLSPPHPATVLMSFPDWEEWFGVVVEGVWASEAGASKVRIAQQRGVFFMTFAERPSGPSPWAPDEKPINPSDRFAERYDRAITRILMEESDLYFAMKSSRGWFNPIKVHSDRQSEIQ